VRQYRRAPGFRPRKDAPSPSPFLLNLWCSLQPSVIRTLTGRSDERESCSVAVGSGVALIWDIGALLDYFVEGAPDHRLFRNAIDQARTLRSG
jgi:hypothetical protein